MIRCDHQARAIAHTSSGSRWELSGEGGGYPVDDLGRIDAVEIDAVDRLAGGAALDQFRQLRFAVEAGRGASGRRHRRGGGEGEEDLSHYGFCPDSFLLRRSDRAPAFALALPRTE